MWGSARQRGVEDDVSRGRLAAADSDLSAAAAAAAAAEGDERLDSGDVLFDAEAEDDNEIDSLAFGGALEMQPRVLGRSPDPAAAAAAAGSLSLNVQQQEAQAGGPVQWLRRLLRLQQQQQEQQQQRVPRPRRRRYESVVAEGIHAAEETPASADQQQQLSPRRRDSSSSSSSDTAAPVVTAAAVSPPSGILAAVHRAQALLRESRTAAAATPGTAAPAAAAPAAAAATAAEAGSGGSSSEAQGRLQRFWRRLRVGPSDTSAAATAAEAAAAEAAAAAEEDEEDAEQDDPTCQQLLLAGGLLCWAPLLWILGAVLFAVTPRPHRRARRWGALNALLMVLFFFFSALRLWKSPPPRSQRILFYGRATNPELAASGSVSSGVIWEVSGRRLHKTKLLYMDAADSSAFQSWVPLPLSLEQQQQQLRGLTLITLSSEQLLGSGWGDELVLGPDVEAFDGLFAATALQSPAVLLGGRVQVAASFVAALDDAAAAKASAAAANAAAEAAAAAAARKRASDKDVDNSATFPKDLCMDSLPRGSNSLPAGFSGLALRCLEVMKGREGPHDMEEAPELLLLQPQGSLFSSSSSEQIQEPKWILLPPKQLLHSSSTTSSSSSSTVWGIYTASEVVAFTSKHVCSLVVLYTPKQRQQLLQQEQQQQLEAPLVYVRTVTLKPLP